MLDSSISFPELSFYVKLREKMTKTPLQIMQQISCRQPALSNSRHMCDNDDEGVDLADAALFKTNNCSVTVSEVL